MEISYGSKARKRRKPIVKTILFLCVFTLILGIGFFFYSVKTNASVLNNFKQSSENGTLIADESASLVKNQNLILSQYPSIREVVKLIPTIKSSSNPPPASNTSKTVYLTFDDGPSKDITPQVLDILNKYCIKANFFLIGEQCKYCPEMVIKEKEDGNAICNHTYSHKYKSIYSSVESFLKDLKKCDSEIKSILGDEYTPKFIRFPGGGFGKKFTPYRDAVKKTGYTTISWNIDTSDSSGKNVPAEKLIENVKTEIKNVPKNHSVIILMHDMEGKQTTVDALPAIIEYLQSEGYSFSTFK